MSGREDLRGAFVTKAAEKFVCRGLPPRTVAVGMVLGGRPKASSGTPPYRPINHARTLAASRLNREWFRLSKAFLLLIFNQEPNRAHHENLPIQLTGARERLVAAGFLAEQD